MGKFEFLGILEVFCETCSFPEIRSFFVETCSLQVYKSFLSLVFKAWMEEVPELHTLPIEHLYHRVIESKSPPPPTGTFGQHQSPCRQYLELMYGGFRAVIQTDSYYSAVIQTACSSQYCRQGLHYWPNHGGIIIWSGPGGWIVLILLAGVYCVHYIGEKDCTARFATGAIWEIPE